MSLDLKRLYNLVDLAEGFLRARCPACAEKGQDSKGEHLRIYPDGRFGCCVFPGDNEHRKRIFALVGESRPRGISVKVAPPSSGSAHKNVLGRLGRVFASPMAAPNASDASDGCKQVQTEFENLRTPRTGETESSQTLENNSRTPRTPSLLLTRIENEIDKRENDHRELIEFAGGVRSVRDGEEASKLPTELEEGVRGVREEKEPFLLADGTLVVPFNSPERFHWWNGGQSVTETLNELRKRN